MNSFQEQIERTKEIHKILCKEYGYKVPLEFKNLHGKGGYLVTAKIKGGTIVWLVKIVLDNSGQCWCDPDYCLCHEFAHAILVTKKGFTGHDKQHANITKKLAKRFDLI